MHNKPYPVSLKEWYKINKIKNITVMSKIGQITTCYLRILVNSAIYSKIAILTNSSTKLKSQYTISQ